MTARTKFSPGDRVRYSSQFCRTIGAATGWTPQARGTVLGLWGKNQELVRIRWDHHPDGPGTEGGAHISALQCQTPTGWAPRH